MTGTDVLVAVLAALGAFLLGLGIGLNGGQKDVLKSCQKLGGAIVDETAITCAVRP